MLLIFVVITVGVGIYARKRTADVNQFVLGGRSIGPWMSALALRDNVFFSRYLRRLRGPVRLEIRYFGHLDRDRERADRRMAAWLVRARRTRLMTHHLGSATMPDFFESRFNCKNLKIAASVILFVFLIPYTASLYNGLSRIFGIAFNIDYSICIIAMAVLTAVYVIVGGYVATAINNLIQGLVMLVGIVAIIIVVLNGQGGFSEALSSLSNLPNEAGIRRLHSLFADPWDFWGSSC
jgi:SSS family solute:Na+ symporter